MDDHSVRDELGNHNNMSISITNLNNDAAAAKAFSLIGRDRVISEWINSADSDDDFQSKLTIKQQNIGKSPNGIPLRRTLVQAKASSIDNSGGSSAAVSPNPMEEFTVNLTLTGPELLTSLSSSQRRDAVAFVRNLVTSSVIDQLLRGEV